MNTVRVLGSLGQELDPVLDLSHPGIHSMAGALAAIAHHSHLGKPKYIMFTNCGVYISLSILFSMDVNNLPSILKNHQRASRVSLA